MQLISEPERQHPVILLRATWQAIISAASGRWQTRGMLWVAPDAVSEVGNTVAVRAAQTRCSVMPALCGPGAAACCMRWPSRVLRHVSRAKPHRCFCHRAVAREEVTDSHCGCRA